MPVDTLESLAASLHAEADRLERSARRWLAACVVAASSVASLYWQLFG